MGIHGIKDWSVNRQKAAAYQDNKHGGQTADVKSVATSSFGKAFLLPIDVLLGWIFANDKRQRLLSRAANTIVIRTRDETGGNQNITYRKD